MSKTRQSKRWSEAQARRELARWKQSGTSMAAFAARHGYQRQRLHWWRKRLEASTSGAGNGAASLAVALAPAVVTGVMRQPALVVSVEPSVVTVEVLDTASVPAEWVAGLARELRAGQTA